MVHSHFNKGNDMFSHQLISLMPFDLKPGALSLIQLDTVTLGLAGGIGRHLLLSCLLSASLQSGILLVFGSVMKKEICFD